MNTFGDCMDLLVNVDIDDLEKAAAFHSSVLGLKIGRRFGVFGVEMLGASAPLYLIVKSAGTQTSDASLQRRTYERHWTPVHLDFVVMKSRRRFIRLSPLERG